MAFFATKIILGGSLKAIDARASSHLLNTASSMFYPASQPVSRSYNPSTLKF